MLKSTLEKIYNREYHTTVTAKGLEQIAQSERNATRKELLDAMTVDLDEIAATLTDFLGDSAGLEFARVQDGIAIGIPNQELGVFYIKLNITIPELEYDFDEAVDSYNAAQERIEERRQAKLAKANKNAAKTK